MSWYGLYGCNKKFWSCFLTVAIIVSLSGCKKKPRLLETSSVQLFISISVSTITDRAAVITWSANKSVLVGVEYGSSTEYGQKQKATSSGIFGSFSLAGLQTSTVYHFHLIANDNEGNVEISNNYTFTTSGPLQAIIITPTAVSLFMEGTQLFSASGVDAAQKTVEINPTWTLSDTTLGALDRGAGLQVVYRAGLAKGMVQLTAAEGSISATATITIIGGPYPEPPENGVIYRSVGSGSELVMGYDIGVNTGAGKTDWLNENKSDWTLTHDYMKMAYPGDAVFGAVFIVVAPMAPLERMGERKAFDYRLFTKLQVELKGEVGGEKVKIGLKDINDPDDGAETKYMIANLTTEWQTYEIPLSVFPKEGRATLSQIYLPLEFVWDNDSGNGLNALTPTTVFFRNVKYVK